MTKAMLSTTNRQCTGGSAVCGIPEMTSYTVDSLKLTVYGYSGFIYSTRFFCENLTSILYPPGGRKKAFMGPKAPLSFWLLWPRLVIFFYCLRAIKALFRTAATISPHGGKSYVCTLDHTKSQFLFVPEGFAPRCEKNLDFMVTVRNYYYGCLTIMICVCARQWVSLFVCQSVSQLVSQSVSLSVCLSVSLCMFAFFNKIIIIIFSLLYYNIFFF